MTPAAFDAAFAAVNRQADADRSPGDILAEAAQACLGGPADADAVPALAAFAEAAEAGPVALALYALALLEAGNTSAAASALRRALARMPNHLHLQALLRQADGTADDPELNTRFCSAPFENIETEPGGDVHFCCPAWLPVPIGNLAETRPGEIWNSAAARAIRASIHDGSYRYCSRLHCPKLSGRTLPRRAAPGNARLARIAEARETALADGPKKIVLSHDRSCNLSCPSCRSGLIVARKEEQQALNRMADEVLFPLMRHAERLRVTASGDPFGSAHFQYVLRHLDRAENPELKLDLQTNGVLLTPALWERLGLEGRVRRLMVSADAAEAGTYAILRRGGRWEDLRRNLDFFAALRRTGRIGQFRLDFVVQAENFRQMPDFVHLARRLGCDAVKFQMIRSWGTMSAADFARADISNPGHPDYAAFLEVLRAPQLSSPYAELWGMEGALSDARAALPA